MRVSRIKLTVHHRASGYDDGDVSCRSTTLARDERGKEQKKEAMRIGHARVGRSNYASLCRHDELIRVNCCGHWCNPRTITRKQSSFSFTQSRLIRPV